MISRRRFLLSAAATAAVTAPAVALHAQQKHDEKPADPHFAAPVDNSPLPEPIAALSNRTKDIVPITVEERANRIDLARELMKQYGLDAILITTGASLRYFSSAQWGQSERLFAYVIPQSAAPFVVCPYLERDHLNEIMPSFPERETTLTYLWHENEDPYDLLRRGLAESNVTTGTLGLEEHTQYAFANGIARGCPALKLASATPVTAGCRSLKSPAELALLKLANQITFDVYKAVYLSCAPGDTNRKFVELVDKAYARCGVRGSVSLNVGVYSAIPHGSAKTQVIHEREMVIIDDGCTVDGYTSDISRSFVYGKPTDEQRAVFEIVHNAQDAALAAAGPGVPMQIVDGAARQVIVKAGYGPGYDFFTHRVGHGIGLDMHEWPYLVQGNTQKMMAGMVFSNEPGIYIPQKFGIRLEDDMFITDHGAEMFTWQSPSLMDPFAIPAVLPDKSAETDTATPDATKPADTPVTPPKP